MKADAPFGRPHGIGVLGAESFKDTDGTIIHFDGEGDTQNAFWFFENIKNILGNPQLLASLIDLDLNNFIRVQRLKFVRRNGGYWQL